MKLADYCEGRKEDKKAFFKATYNRGHVVLDSRWDEHTQVRFTAVHAQIHGWWRLGLHVLVHASGGHQQTG